MGSSFKRIDAISALLRVARAKAIADHYRSVDSVPTGYAVNRRAAVANSFYVTFLLASLILLTILVMLIDEWKALRHGDLVFFCAGNGTARTPIRLFFVIFFLVYALYAFGSRGRRALLAASLVGKLVLAALIIDIAALVFYHYHLLDVPLFVQQLATGLCALAIFPHTILSHAKLPPRTSTTVSSGAPWEDYANIALVTLCGTVIAAAVIHSFNDEVQWLRSVALLGGIGPGVFLVQQVFATSFAAIGALRLADGRRCDFSPPIAILIPAHNEGHGIEATIAAADRAAGEYAGHVRIYVIDNASLDDTAARAGDGIASCRHSTGVVLSCPRPGKAVALNFGFSHITEDFIVRIDADTIIGATALAIGMRHFADPRVGALGGLPMPIEGHGLIPKARLVEVLVRHGFFQVALGGFNGILGVPGMFAIYRHASIKQVRGTTEGMNGEDTDIVLRINATGYRVVSDPKVVYYSETPADYSHLREQRLRWFRSIYHISANNRQLLLQPRLVSCFVVLPFMLISAARRAMLLPLVIYCVLVWSLFSDTFDDRVIQGVLAMVFGMPMLMAVMIFFIFGRFYALIYLPIYLGFRLLRSYFTLASALTLIYPPLGAEPRQSLAATSSKKRLSAT